MQMYWKKLWSKYVVITITGEDWSTADHFNNKLIPLVDEILVDSSNSLLVYLLWDSLTQEEG